MVLRKSKSFIFLCRLQPAVSYTRVRLRFSFQNCCRLHFFAEISESFSSLKLLVTISGYIAGK